MNNLYKFPCNKAEYMLLSYKKHTTASSALAEHGPCCAVDGNESTSWIPKEVKPGEWLCVDLGAIKSVHAVKLCCNCAVSLYGSSDGKSYDLLGEKLEETSTGRLISFENELRLRFLKLILTVPAVNRFSVTCFDVLGFGNGNPPKRVEKPFAVITSDTDAVISWNKVSTAIGYKIRFGMGPDKLNEVGTVYGEDSISIKMPSKSPEKYYYAVDSINENGITKGDIERIGFKACILHR